MRRNAKLGLSGYAFIYGLTALIGFQFGDAVPQPTIYILLTCIFVIPTVLGIRDQLSEPMKAVLLIVTPLLPGLLIVDPLEPGFYGYDPYRTLETAYLFRSEGALWIASNRASWPFFYAFIWTVRYIISGEIAKFGQLLPLFSIVAPLVFYTLSRRLLENKTAFLAAMGFISVRTLVGFETKFVDESIAFVLFYVFLFTINLRRYKRRRGQLLSYAVGGAATLSHPYVGLLCLCVTVLWDASKLVERIQNSAWDGSIPLSGVTIAVGGMFATMFVTVAPEFLIRLFEVADFSLTDSDSGPRPPITDNTETTPIPPEQTETPRSPEQTETPRSPEQTETPRSPEQTETPRSPEQTETPRSPEQTETPRSPGGGNDPNNGTINSLTNPIKEKLGFFPTNILLAGVAAIVGTNLRRVDTGWSQWQIISSVLSSLLAAGYGISVVFGPIVPLDPSRYLVYMVPILLLAVGYRVADGTQVISNRIVAIFVILLFITQIVLIAPGVLYTDPSQTTVSEDHHSPDLLASSDFMSKYGEDRIIGWERGLWERAGVFWRPHGEKVSCEVPRVWRSDAPFEYVSPTDSVFYNNGDVRLYRCA